MRVQAAEGREQLQAELARSAQSQVAELQVRLQSLQEKNRSLEVRAAEAERSKVRLPSFQPSQHLCLNGSFCVNVCIVLLRANGFFLSHLAQSVPEIVRGGTLISQC